MKKNVLPLFTLAVGALFTLASCGNNNTPVASSSAASSSVASSSSSVVPSSSEQPSSSSSEDPSVHTVTFCFYDWHTEVVTVEDGATVDSKIDGTLPTEGYKWYGWYNGKIAYDFSAPVKSNLYLVSSAKSYENIKAVVKVQIPEGHTYADGEFLQGRNQYEGHLMEELDTNVYPHLLFMQFRGFVVNNYRLYDSQGQLVDDTVAPGDKIVLSDEEMTLVPEPIAQDIAISFDTSKVTVEEGDASFESVTHALASDYALPTTVPTVEDGKYFVGWQIKGRDEGKTYGETYLPGEVITSDDLLLIKEAITFIPYILNSKGKNVYTVTTAEKLLSVASGSTVILGSDIDFGGADVGAGMGDGDWSGLIYGNGHAIKNYLVNSTGEQSFGGLIDNPCGSLSVYNLKISDVTLYANGSWGTGALVGEIDGYDGERFICKDVDVSNVSLAPYASTGGGNHAIGGLVGDIDYASPIFSDVTVDGFTTENAGAFPYTSTMSCTTNQPRLGALVGNANDSDGSKYENVRITNSKVIIDGDCEFSMGGMIGYVDTCLGMEITNCSVKDTVVEARNVTPATKNGATYTLHQYVGGLIGYTWELPTMRTDVFTEAVVPSSVSRNDVDADVGLYYKGDHKFGTDVSTLYGFIGGMVGDFNFHGVGDLQTVGVDENGEPVQHRTWRGCPVIGDNKVTGTVTANGQEGAQDNVFLGGIAGEIDTDCSNYGFLYVENNYVDEELTVAASGTHIQVGGICGSFSIERSSGVHMYSDVVMGKINAPSSTGGYKTAGGLIGNGATEGTNDFDYCYVGAEMNCGAYGNLIGYMLLDEEEEYSVVTYGENMVYDIDKLDGTMDSNIGHGIHVSAEHTAAEQAMLESAYFSSDENGQPVFHR